MQLHRQWQEAEEPGSMTGICDSLLSINGIANSEQTHEILQRSFRVTGNRICLNMKKHGYTSMDAAGGYHITVNFFILLDPLACLRVLRILLCDMNFII